MGLRPGYKQTEVGVVPDDWEVKQIHEVCDFIVPGRNKPTRFDGDIPWITTPDLVDGRYVSESRLSLQVSEAEAKTIGSKVVPAGSVLMSCAGELGIVALCNRSIVINQQLHAFLPSGAILPSFLAYVIKNQSAYISRVATKTAVPYLNKDNCNSIPLPLPDLAEQEVIAAALRDADALIESLEQLLAKKRRLKQGAMQELLTGKKRLKGFTGKWARCPLRDFVLSFIVPMRDKPKRLTGAIPWCRIEDFDGIYLDGSKSGQGVDTSSVQAMNLKVYPVGTLLVSCSADLGRCAIVSRPLVSNQTFIGLSMNEVVASNLFFYYYMTSKAEDLNNLSSGTTISYLSREQFEEFGVFVPLDREEQQTIAAILCDMDADIAMLEAKLAKGRQIKQGMMQELLTGRIRLV